jgi:CubicO group peptidase (beta-lactamase class C family)
MTTAPFPDAAAMAGFPPSPASRVTPDNWFRNPWLRWGFLHRSALVRTAPVWRGDGAVSTIPRGDADLGSLPVTGRDGAPSTLDALASDCDLDALLVLHHGRIVHERWIHMRPHDLHTTASVSKSVLALVAGILAAQGALELGRAVAHYVPELHGAAMGDATLQQLLDMQAAIVRPPMADRPGQVGGQDGGVYEILGLMPRAPGAPADFYAWMLAKPRHGTPGGQFYYDNGQVEAVAWAIRRATGTTIAELVGELLWAPLGCERDAFYSVDETGAEMASGGLSATLRDLARIGETMRAGGAWNGRQVVPEAFVADTLRGGDASMFARSDFGPRMPGASYRNFWWLSHDAYDGFLAVGRYGQRIYVAPRAALTIVHFGSMEGPPPHPNDAALGRAYREIAGALS